MRWWLAGFYGVILSLAAGSSAYADSVLRVGHFPNLTHPQPLVGRETGEFEKDAGVKIEWMAFNAGASAMEALLAGELDLAYVGPSPAVNAYVRSKGRVLRVIAGAASGGVALVVRKDMGIRNPADLRGKRVAVPGLGNTQDVALRSWLKANGLDTGDSADSVQVMPVKNPEIFTLFQRKELDAAWVPEPWATRLIQEAGGALFVDERNLWPASKFPATLLVARTDFLAKNRALVKRFVATHVDITEAIIKNPDEAKRIINAELAKLMGKPLPAALLDEAFTRIAATYDPISGALLKSARQAWELRYLPGAQPPDVQPIFDLSLLNEVLRERGKPLVTVTATVKR